MKNGFDKLDVLHLDTWDISKGFINCSNLTSISNWDVSNVTSMYDVFSKCTTLDEDYVLKERRKKLEKIMKKIDRYWLDYLELYHKEKDYVIEERKKKLKKLNITDNRVSLMEDYFIPVRPNIVRERRHKLEKIITIINEINKTKS